MIVWTESVLSIVYQAAKVVANAAENTAVVANRLIPKLSVRLSVISVPTTLTNTTVSQ